MERNCPVQKAGTQIAPRESNTKGMSEFTARKVDKEVVPTTCESSSQRSSQEKTGVRSAFFKYYIHDSVPACRLQLIGELTEAQVPELNGCWSTARTTLGNRKLVLDVRGLKTADEAGRQWLVAMADEGATYVPESYLRGGLGSQAGTPDGPRTRPFGRLLSILRGSRALPAESSTQAQ